MFGGIHGIVETLSSAIVIDWNGFPLGRFFMFVTFHTDMNSVINEYVKKDASIRNSLNEAHTFGYDNYPRFLT